MLLISPGAEDTKLAGPVRLPGLKGPEGGTGRREGCLGVGGQPHPEPKDSSPIEAFSKSRAQ